MARPPEVNEEPIGDALARRADEAEHDDYFHRIQMLVDHYVDTRPRIDSGEGMVWLEEEFERIFLEECEDAGRQLRRRSFEPGNGPGGMDIVTEPFIPPSQRKETRT